MDDMESWKRSELSRAELVKLVYWFLEEFARISPNYDPQEDMEGERFTGPDPGELYYAARFIEQCIPLDSVPRSDWESGCYSPIESRDGKECHAAILSAVKSYVVR